MKTIQKVGAGFIVFLWIFSILFWGVFAYSSATAYLRTRADFFDRLTETHIFILVSIESLGTALSILFLLLGPISKKEKIFILFGVFNPFLIYGFFVIGVLFTCFTGIFSC